MGKYYNKNRVGLPLSLQSGKSVMVPGRATIEITPEDEGSPALVKAVSKGFLVMMSPSVVLSEKASEVPLASDSEKEPELAVTHEPDPVSAPEEDQDSGLELAVKLESEEEKPRRSRRKTKSRE